MSNNAKKGCLIAVGIVVFLAIVTISNVIRTYNNMVKLDEGVKEKWSQVENTYQRRYDLIPNLVNTVKKIAAHEKDTFTAVSEARSKAGGTFNISDEVLNDPAMFQKFQQAQSGLSGALQRLMVVMEKYPDLKANQNFLALQDELEGTENRIAVERKRFNEAARYYNTYIKMFPKVILANMFRFEEKQYFKSAEGAQEAPKVEF
ncbi:MAG: LemA family protein [Candidatus Cloacimonetes bacterium]|jgi:LemA protein|nr:LemA family protein [Candidatus Cloacimonadota bacterium]MBT4332483.1 LemA family protein [Candidatus Cloacimonadota bacterium]MBT4576552.1 LemA family protein [Candidatus Cloacimonadota bacterium]MBT5419819.1 LemA family protein [Candidatus Cloacimonadota bacterium]